MCSERNVRAPTARRSAAVTSPPPGGGAPVSAFWTGLDSVQARSPPGRSRLLQQAFEDAGGALERLPVLGGEAAEAVGEVGVLLAAALVEEAEAGGGGLDAR